MVSIVPSKPPIHPIIGARTCGLSVTMSTHTFIQQNQDRIRNIDGNLDDGNITIMGDSGRLEFYYFEDGELVGSQVKVTKW
jgi:hypothetical protein